MSLEKKERYEILSSYEMDTAIKEQPDPDFKLLSKIPSLDQAIEGFEPGELIILGGGPKNGKTLLLQTLTKNFSDKQNQFSLWFSFEMPPKQFLRCFSSLPLFYMPRATKPYDLLWLEKKIIESFQKYHTKVIFIDHLHFLFDLARAKNPSLTLGALARKLKSIANENGFIIFLACHIRKIKKEEDATWVDLRDSSLLAGEADAVFMIARQENMEARLRVEFHRRTGAWEKTIELVKIGAYFEEKIQYGRQ